LRGWDEFLTERDRAVFGGAGYGKRAGFGERPVVLVIDVNYNFCGDKPEPILESIKRWHNSCGEEAWVAIEKIKQLVDAAHERRIPVIYSTGCDPRPDRFDAGRWADKNSRRGEDLERRGIGNEIVPPIAPKQRDIVIRKGKPSVFFGTLLASYLTDLRADSIVACGTTTSGCVRATVIDGFSYNYRMSLVEECTFDRGQASHSINLFDMSQKYSDIVSLEETLAYMQQLPDDLFTEQMPGLAEPVEQDVEHTLSEAHSA